MWCTPCYCPSPSLLLPPPLLVLPQDTIVVYSDLIGMRPYMTLAASLLQQALQAQGSMSQVWQALGRPVFNGTVALLYS